MNCLDVLLECTLPNAHGSPLTVDLCRRTHDRTAEAARTPEPGHDLSHIRERLGRLLEQENQRTHEGIRERLDEALERAKPVARERPAHGEEHERNTHRQRVRGHGEGWGL